MAEDLRSEKRKKICEGCDGRCCRQSVGPISKDEYAFIEAKPEDHPTIETTRKMMDISCKPVCVERFLKEHPIEWWFNRLIGRHHTFY